MKQARNDYTIWSEVQQCVPNFRDIHAKTMIHAGIRNEMSMTIIIWHISRHDVVI